MPYWSLAKTLSSDLLPAIAPNHTSISQQRVIYYDSQASLLNMWFFLSGTKAPNLCANELSPIGVLLRSDLRI